MQRRKQALGLLIAVIILFSAASRAAAQCDYEWKGGFNRQTSFSGRVHSSVVFDDGTGSALIVGGDFEAYPELGRTYITDIAKWTGSDWQPMGEGLNGPVKSLILFDDGSGKALFAGGDFGIARWDGMSWNEIGPEQFRFASINALAVFDDGSGPALFAGGIIRLASGAYATATKWQANQWSPIALDTHVITALASFDDGNGPALFAAGTFVSIGGTSANWVAKWDGFNWRPVGEGPDNGTNGSISCMIAHDDGSGPALFVGGSFTTAGGQTANRVAKWNGEEWSPLASGLNNLVHTFHVFDDGTGPALYVGSQFLGLPATEEQAIVKWNGHSWNTFSIGARFSRVYMINNFDDGNGPALFVSGQSGLLGGMAKYRGSVWSRLAGGIEGGYETPGVWALKEFHDNQGRALYAAGEFGSAGETTIKNSIARWDGNTWSAVPKGPGPDWLTPIVYDLESFDDGTGQALYAAGFFWKVNNDEECNSVAKWDGTSWTPVGNGLLAFGWSDGTGPGVVYALTLHDDGNGPALYAGGYFHASGDKLMEGVAKWNGAFWEPLGDGLTAGPEFSFYGGVRALASYDEGDGPALYAGGYFTGSGNMQLHNIARWKDGAWSPVSGGINSPYAGVEALATYDDGTGNALYVGGSFTQAGLIPANAIARFQGGRWSALGEDLTYFGTQGWVTSLLKFNDGRGDALYVGGYFTLAGSMETRCIARWDGKSWEALDVGVGDGGDSRIVTSMCRFDDSNGPTLYVAGDFRTAGDRSSWNIAKWAPADDAPPITQQPLPQSACTGGAARLSVKSSSQEPLTYQWRKNGLALDGATTAILDINPVTPADAGFYDCVITAPCGRAVSDRAPLQVLPGGQGDGDSSETTDGADIQRFVTFLLSTPPATRSLCAYDLDDSGVVELADLPPFLDVLLAP